MFHRTNISRSVFHHLYPKLECVRPWFRVRGLRKWFDKSFRNPKDCPPSSRNPSSVFCDGLKECEGFYKRSDLFAVYKSI